MRMTEQDWDDAADLFDQCAAMANDSTQTHAKAGCDYVVKRCLALSMFAQGKANALKAKSSHDASEPSPSGNAVLGPT
jgi:hypothetical protein